jgi:hypothetical protein
MISLSPTNGTGSIMLLKDFYSMSGCRDLLFHVQEHQFDINQLSLVFKSLNLEFLGFLLPEPTVQIYKARFPDDNYMIDLEKWRLFEEENPDTFRSMYQFYVRKYPGNASPRGNT